MIRAVLEAIVLAADNLEHRRHARELDRLRFEDRVRRLEKTARIRAQWRTLDNMQARKQQSPLTGSHTTND